MAAVRRTVAGEPGVVLVGGEAGVGKSRLLEAALEDAPGVRVLTGGCIELGGDGLPFVPLVDALRTLVRTTPPDDLDRVLGPARGELARLLPELGAAGRSPRPDSGSTAQLFELLLGVLGRLAARPAAGARGRGPALGRPVHARPGRLPGPRPAGAARCSWCSATAPTRSTGVLRCARCCRPGSGSAAWSACTCRGFAAPKWPPRWPPSSAGRPMPRCVDPVFERSEGNAFFVEELLRTLREGASAHELPPSLRDVLLARAERLPAPAQRLLRTAAVAGRWVPERLLAEVADLRPASSTTPCARRWTPRCSSSTASGRGYAFRHALTRDAVYADLLPGERSDLHTAYAEALDRDPRLAGEDVSVAATLAVHWYAAYDLPRALAASVRAGREAMAGYAPAEARRHLERALEVWRGVPDPETWAGTDKVEVLAWPPAPPPPAATRTAACRWCSRPRSWSARTPIPSGSRSSSTSAPRRCA